MYYGVRPGYSPIMEVRILQPNGRRDVIVYCPPGVAGGPWVESFPTKGQAMDLASILAGEIVQLPVKTVTTSADWLLNGLTLIGDSDERDRLKRMRRL